MFDSKWLFLAVLASGCGDDSSAERPADLSGVTGADLSVVDLAPYVDFDLAVAPRDGGGDMVVITGPDMVPLVTCVDGIKNGMETDTDCGGPTCPECANGKMCLVGGDCTSSSCQANVCGNPPVSCSNHVRDGKETDIDCGGVCVGCDIGKKCLVNGDCLSGTCTNNVCAVPGCSNGIKDGMETDVDCGGLSCLNRCALGKMCKVNTDCMSQSCEVGVCANPANTCKNGFRDGMETDVDCGGAMCPGCANGKKCAMASDCANGSCTQNVCGDLPNCNDGIKNGTETDVDCGGLNCVNRCALGKTCRLNSDCQSVDCEGGLCAIAPMSCNNAVQDGMETDVDCGGPFCPPCADGKNCIAPSDCAGGMCNQNKCASDPRCKDGALDDTETDVDCGGMTCPARCAQGKICKINADCQSGACANNKCN